LTIYLHGQKAPIEEASCTQVPQDKLLKAFLIPLQFHFFLALVLNRNLALAKSYVNMSEGIVEYVSCSLAGHSMLLDSCELG